MCDEFSLSDMQRVSRRGFTAMGAAGAAVLAANSAIAAGPALTEKMVQIATPDGHADAFFVHPAHGTHPGILMWPDIAGLRETYKVMARRLAAAGYAVVAVNQYYRSGPAPLLGGLADYFTPAGQAKIKPALDAITPERTARDAAAFVAWLDAQKAVARGRGLGTCGYCIGGGYAVRTAAVSTRVRAVASLHGAALVTCAPPPLPRTARRRWKSTLPTTAGARSMRRRITAQRRSGQARGCWRCLGNCDGGRDATDRSRMAGAFNAGTIPYPARTRHRTRLYWRI